MQPEFATMDEWMRISGMKRSTTYNALAAGHLKAIKLNRRLLIEVQPGLAWLRSMPAAQFHRRSRLVIKQVGTPTTSPAPITPLTKRPHVNPATDLRARAVAVRSQAQTGLLSETGRASGR